MSRGKKIRRSCIHGSGWARARALEEKHKCILSDLTLLLHTGMSKVVVIIGCATGIGRAAARKWAKEGAQLALFDNSDRLRDLVTELSSVTKVLHQIGDITDIGDLESFSHRVFAEYSIIDTLFVNAGIQAKTCYNDPTSIKSLVRTNFFGIVDAVAVFLDHLKAQQRAARIILTGSKQGITNPPGNPGYNSSKAALKSYAEGLSFDLQNTSIRAHLLVPGWTFTNITGDRNGSETKPPGAWTPEQVIDFMDQRLAENAEFFYIICPDNETTIEVDKLRIEWSSQDMVQDRPALSRWREAYKPQFNQFMNK